MLGPCECPGGGQISTALSSFPWQRKFAAISSLFFYKKHVPSSSCWFRKSREHKQRCAFFKTEHWVLLLLSRSAEANRANKIQWMISSDFVSWLKLSMGEDETQFWKEQFRAGGKQVMLLSPRQIWVPEAGASRYGCLNPWRAPSTGSFSYGKAAVRASEGLRRGNENPCSETVLLRYCRNQISLRSKELLCGWSRMGTGPLHTRGSAVWDYNSHLQAWAVGSAPDH